MATGFPACRPGRAGACQAQLLLQQQQASRRCWRGRSS